MKGIDVSLSPRQLRQDTKPVIQQARPSAETPKKVAPPRNALPGTSATEHRPPVRRGEPIRRDNLLTSFSPR